MLHRKTAEMYLEIDLDELGVDFKRKARMKEHYLITFVAREKLLGLDVYFVAICVLTVCQ